MEICMYELTAKVSARLFSDKLESQLSLCVEFMLLSTVIFEIVKTQRYPLRGELWQYPGRPWTKGCHVYTMSCTETVKLLFYQGLDSVHRNYSWLRNGGCVRFPLLIMQERFKLLRDRQIEKIACKWSSSKIEVRRRYIFMYIMSWSEKLKFWSTCPFMSNKLVFVGNWSVFRYG